MIERFVTECTALAAAAPTPSDAVAAIAPRMLSSFHVYDIEAGTRALIEAPHSES